jgi:hypothetical protein
MKRCSRKRRDDGSGNPPTYFRLPKSGERDDWFQLSKTAYYNLAQAGHIRLVRITKPEQDRGTTLVKYAEMLAYVQSLSPQGNA